MLPSKHKLLFHPDAGDSGTQSSDDQSQTTPRDADGNKDNPSEDVTGLKTALERERNARKDLEKQLKALKGTAETAKSAEERLAKLEAELTTAKQREAATTAVTTAAKGLKGFELDVDRALKLVLRQINSGDDLDEIVSDVVESLKRPVGKTPATATQPPGTSSSVPKKEALEYSRDELSKLSAEDPERYKAVMEARRAARHSQPMFGGPKPQ